MHKPKTAQEIFAENLLAYGRTQQTISDGAKKNAGSSTHQRTVGRAMKGGGNPTLKTLNAIAASLGAQAWQLLMPGNISHFPRTGKAAELMNVILKLNEPGIIAVVALCQKKA